VSELAATIRGTLLALRVEAAPLLLRYILRLRGRDFDRWWQAYADAAGHPLCSGLSPRQLSIVAGGSFDRDTLGKIAWHATSRVWGQA
jgi:hypothetical protein